MSIDSGEPSSNGAAARGRSTALSSKSGQCRVDRRVDEAEHKPVAVDSPSPKFSWPPNLAVLLTDCAQLILRKIS